MREYRSERIQLDSCLADEGRGQGLACCAPTDKEVGSLGDLSPKPVLIEAVNPLEHQQHYVSLER